MDQHCAKQAKIQRMKKTKKADFLFDFSITPLRHIKSTPNCTSTPSPNLIFFNFLYWRRYFYSASQFRTLKSPQHLLVPHASHLRYTILHFLPPYYTLGSDGKESACNAGDLGSNPESGRFSWTQGLPIPSDLASAHFSITLSLFNEIPNTTGFSYFSERLTLFPSCLQLFAHAVPSTWIIFPVSYHLALFHLSVYLQILSWKYFPCNSFWCKASIATYTSVCVCLFDFCLMSPLPIRK